MKFKFKPLPKRPGLSEYEVYNLDHQLWLGVVSRRRGGWWRSYDNEGHIHGSWYDTRKDAAWSLLPGWVLEESDEPSDDEIDAFEAEEARRKTS